MKKTDQTFLILDANSLVHRAFHALPPLHTSHGEMVNAVYGFFATLMKAMKEFSPGYVGAAFDVKGDTFRHGKFTEYKATRGKAPDELYAQIAMVRDALVRMGVPIFQKERYEADDCIGTFCAQVQRKNPSARIIIATGDQDAFQLIQESVKVYTMRKGIGDTALFGQKEVRERFGGLTPKQVPDYKGLRGDASDNIPGVPGIGEKTAIQLLLNFGTLPNLYRALKNKKEPGAIKPRIAKLLLENKERAFLSRDLAIIDRNVPLKVTIDALQWNEKRQEGMEEVFEKFQFRALLRRAQHKEAPRKGGQLRFGEASNQEDGDERRERIEELFRDGVLSKEMYSVEQRLLPVIQSMEKIGININPAHFAKLQKQFTKTIGALEAEIYELATRAFNINSPQQLSGVIFDTLSLSEKGLKKTPGGAVSTASEELEKLKEEHAIIAKVLQYRELQKLLTTYIRPLPELVDENNRLHTHFDQFGAATGRISSAHPNLQNIPVQGEWGREIRKGFVPERGKTFASFDYSQMELRLAAHITKDKKMQEAFLSGEDIHRASAAAVFRTAPEKVTKEMRFRAKALNFGILYGMGAQGFAQSAGIPVGEAKEFIENYFVRFPGIRNYIEQTKEFARKNGYAETMFGRRRYILDINSTNPQLRAAAERVAINHPIQGASADIIKMAMVQIAEEMASYQDEGTCSLLLQIHDELLFEAEPEALEKAAPVIMGIMEHVRTLDVPIVVEEKRGKSWGELEG